MKKVKEVEKTFFFSNLPLLFFFDGVIVFILTITITIAMKITIQTIVIVITITIITTTILHGLTQTILLSFVGKKHTRYLRKASYLRNGRPKVKTP